MNKIMIVGHHASQIHNVESLLRECGMAAPLPSRREGLTAEQISDTMLRAHASLCGLHDETGSGLQQIEAGPIWHGMALDLILGNLDQTFWGWSDTKAVQLLDYWRSLDPAITFVLVYADPASILVQMKEGAASISPAALGDYVRHWQNYNEALLSFYRSNTNRCLLVHADAVQLSAERFLWEIRNRVNISQSHSKRSEVAGRRGHGGDHSDAADKSVLISIGEPVCALKAHLSTELVHKFPEAIQLYEELQHAANLPNRDRQSVSLYDAWDALMEKSADKTALEFELEATRNNLENTLAEQKLSKKEIESLLVNVDLAKERLEALDKLAQRLAEQTKLAIEQENRLMRAEEEIQNQREIVLENATLVAQLHKVQEQLETSVKKTVEQQKKIKELELSLDKKKILEQDNNVLKSQIQNQQKKIESLVNCEKLAVERLQMLDATKQKLCEQAILIERHTSQLKEANLSLMKHNLLEQENETLIVQLHKVQEELEQRHSENRRRAAAEAATKSQKNGAHYGAADRVKRQLSYRLGAIMVTHSRSMLGWVKMPWMLTMEVRNFRAESLTRIDQKLPSIAKYADAHEAVRARQHLSFRLGHRFIELSRNPVTWVKIPFALSREVRAFKLERQLM